MPSSNPPCHVVFFQVQNPSQKILAIANTVQHHFGKKEAILLFVEGEKSALFVDELLWKFPENGFLPHAIVEIPREEKIAITRKKERMSSATIAFNLCPTPLMLDGFRHIYELEDLFDPHKQQLAAMRFDRYKQARYAIEARSLAL